MSVLAEFTVHGSAGVGIHGLGSWVPNRLPASSVHVCVGMKFLHSVQDEFQLLAGVDCALFTAKEKRPGGF